MMTKGGLPDRGGYTLTEMSGWLVLVGLLAQLLILPVMVARLRSEQRQATTRVELQVVEMRARLMAIEHRPPCLCPRPAKSWGNRR